MTLQEAEALRNLFLSKAPKEYYIESPVLAHRGTRHGGLSLFDGTFDSSTKVASLAFRELNGNIEVTLYLGWDEYKFIENTEICKNIIQDYIPKYSVPKLKAV